MKKTLRILVVAIFSLMLFQNCQKSDFIVVTGVLRDSVTSLPLEGIRIDVNGKEIFSSSDGTFSLDGNQAGKYKLSIYDRSQQYYSQSKSVIITEGRVNKIDFNLRPVPKPQIITGSLTNVTGNRATASGTAKLNLGSFDQHGHVWSSSTYTPTLLNCLDFSRLGSGSGMFTFVSNITSLEPNTVYYVRAYVTSASGLTIYGNTVAFKTSELGIDEGLIFYYPFNNNPVDLSGNGFELWDEMGTPSYTADRFGAPNQACHFSVGKWYGGRHSAVIDFAVSLWFRKSGLWESSQEHLIQIGDRYGSLTEERIFIAQDVSPSKFSAGLYINGSLGTKYKTSLNFHPSLGAWHHVVAMRKGTSFSLYLDGQLMGSIPCPSDVLPTSYYFNIGGAWTPGYQQFHGDLDEVRFYNRALSEAEIQYLFKN